MARIADPGALVNEAPAMGALVAVSATLDLAHFRRGAAPRIRPRGRANVRRRRLLFGKMQGVR